MKPDPVPEEKAVARKFIKMHFTPLAVLALMVIAAPVTVFGDDEERDRAPPSATDCDIIAERASRDAGGMGDGRIARGAVRGAVIGGALGRSKGAKRGAALGAIAGGARRSRARNDTYDRVFDDCMRGYTRY